MKAAIDIGTNTVLLLVAEVQDGKIKNIHEEHRVPRLGKGVDADKNINEAATERVITALSAYKTILDKDFPEVDLPVITATSAVRDAANRDEFIQKVKSETGYEIRLLSGMEEAEWTAAGALSVLPSPENENILILDIGGGSTEVAYFKSGEVKDGHSFDMGSVRFTERFMNGNPPTEDEISACRQEIERMFDNRPFEIEGKIVAVGVAGTVTTLGGILMKLDSYEPDTLNGFSISLDEIRDVIDAFKNNPCEDMLAKYPVYLKGREDIFMAGMLILEGFLNHFGFEALQVSTGGIRHGAILKT